VDSDERQAIVIIIWDFAEFITLCARKGRGIHPGAHVGVELILWIVCIVISGLSFIAAYGLDEEVRSGLYTTKAEDVLRSLALKSRVLGALLDLLA